MLKSVVDQFDFGFLHVLFLVFALCAWGLCRCCVLKT